MYYAKATIITDDGCEYSMKVRDIADLFERLSYAKNPSKGRGFLQIDSTNNGYCTYINVDKICKITVV